MTSQTVDFVVHVICLDVARYVNMTCLFMMESGLVNCSQFASLDGCSCFGMSVTLGGDLKPLTYK